MAILDAGREGLNLPWKLSREDEPVKENFILLTARENILIMIDIC